MSADSVDDLPGGDRIQPPLEPDLYFRMPGRPVEGDELFDNAIAVDEQMRCNPNPR